jgi:hypothetical protein
MEIVDLKDEHKPLYFVCLEDWSEEIQEAGDHKAHQMPCSSTGNKSGRALLHPIKR